MWFLRAGDELCVRSARDVIIRLLPRD